MSRASDLLGFISNTGNIEVFEMANLTKKQTGIDHIVYISTAQGKHGPRVKYYLKPGKSQPCAIITISDNPEKVEDSIGIDSKVEKAIIQFVILNKDNLLKFWYKGDEMTDEEVTEMKNSFIKVS